MAGKKKSSKQYKPIVSMRERTIKRLLALPERGMPRPKIK